jgi:hypothetical protein
MVVDDAALRCADSTSRLDRESEEDRGQDGEIWCMNAQSLNARSDRHLVVPNDPAIKYLAAQVFLDEAELSKLYFELINIREVPVLPLAFIPPLDFPRVAAQMSVSG